MIQRYIYKDHKHVLLLKGGKELQWRVAVYDPSMTPNEQWDAGTEIEELAEFLMFAKASKDAGILSGRVWGTG